MIAASFPIRKRQIRSNRKHFLRPQNRLKFFSDITHDIFNSLATFLRDYAKENFLLASAALIERFKSNSPPHREHGLLSLMENKFFSWV